MKLSDITVEVRDKALNRLGVISNNELDLELIGEHNNVGSWKLILPLEHHLTEAMRTPGSGLIVTGPNDVLMSGPTLQPELAVTPDDLGGTVTFEGTSDTVILADMLAFPEPTNPDPETQLEAYDIRSGLAETVLHEYVDANIGPSAPVARRRGIIMGTDLGRGVSVQKSARFLVLGELLSELAGPSGLGFRIVQRPAGLTFETYEVQDRTAFIRLDARNGTLAGQKVATSAPGLTRVIVAGQGEGVERQLLYFDNAASLQAEADWGRRIERFIDQRQTSDVLELTQAAVEALAEGGDTIISIQAVPVENESMTFGVDWYMGDLVSVVVEDVELSSVVTGYTLLAHDDGFKVGATIGTVGKASATIPDRVIGVEQRVSALERHSNGDPTGSIQMFAGAQAPTGYVKCDGTEYSTATYPRLFDVIGTSYGSSGAGLFKVPDLRNRLPLGASGTRDPGDTGGSETKTIEAAHMAPHTHSMNHQHDIKTRETGPGPQNDKVAGAGGIGTTHDDNTAVVVHSGSTADGSAALFQDPLNVMNPWLAMHFIIKT